MCRDRHNRCDFQGIVKEKVPTKDKGTSKEKKVAKGKGKGKATAAVSTSDEEEPIPTQGAPTTPSSSPSIISKVKESLKRMASHSPEAPVDTRLVTPPHIDLSSVAPPRSSRFVRQRASNSDVGEISSSSSQFEAGSGFFPPPSASARSFAESSSSQVASMSGGAPPTRQRANFDTLLLHHHYNASLEDLHIERTRSRAEKELMMNEINFLKGEVERLERERRYGN